MNIRIVNASAGTGKTRHLGELLGEAVDAQSARPEAILATTFTKQAAAQLLNQARGELLNSGRPEAAQSLLTARIGTVNAVCGSLVTDYALQLGLSPELRVLDEAAAEVTLKRALASTTSEQESTTLQSYRERFDRSFDWHHEVRRLIEAARANGLDAAGLRLSARRSLESLDACLGPVAEDGKDLDTVLRVAVEDALHAIDTQVDTTKGTREYCDLLSRCLRDLSLGRLSWSDWAHLSTDAPTKKSKPQASPVHAAAARHTGHPQLRQEMHCLIGLMFEIASQGLHAYQQLKREQGMLDFVDQEVLALRLLSLPEAADLLQDQLDLVLVDEFQDTSPVQLAIFLKLAAIAKQSVWVGDSKQAIYGFRGTDPALMDAAIKALSDPSRDSDLVATAVEKVTRRAPVETLTTSYRSRPELVDLTNAVFSAAFSAQQATPAQQIRIEPDRTESGELGDAVGYWALTGSSQTNRGQMAAAVASGVVQLLANGPVVSDLTNKVNRPATLGDVAILCRTNAECLGVSEALGELGVASVVARVGLAESAESQVLMAGLRLWVDPRDRLAAATLIRILQYPREPTEFLERVLSNTSDEASDALTDNPWVTPLLYAREQAFDLDVVAAVDMAIEALQLRELCAAWGSQDQRTANLDELRSHATRYVSQREAAGDAPSLVGFLAHFQELAEESGFGTSRRDTIARLGSENAVTVSTWHAAKGLEWPIVALYGLEKVREADAYGVHVLSDRQQFAIDDPLGGRWIHFWPNPYINSSQKGPIKDAYRASEAHQQVAWRAEHEALRVIYVCWTRARDQLIFVARRGKLLRGLLGTVAALDPGIIIEPPLTNGNASCDITWADHPFSVQVRELPLNQEVAPSPSAHVPGIVRVGRPHIDYPPARISPSGSAPRPASLGEPVRLGESVAASGSYPPETIGTAIHAFFAADDPDRADDERLAMADGLLKRHRLTGAIATGQVVALSDRLCQWVAERFGADSVTRTEVPLAMRRDTGTLVVGTTDLLVQTNDEVAVLDHKSFGLAKATEDAAKLAGQLGCYADVLRAAQPDKPVSMWLHLPLAGLVVEVEYHDSSVL